MLSGRYAGSRVRELKPRIVLNRVTQRIKANRGAVLALTVPAAAFQIAATFN